MAETKLSCLWRNPDLSREVRTAVSLHGHTNRSKESLLFIPQLAQKCPMLRDALDKQCRRARMPVDFVRAYWTPPLTPKLAYATEKNQIENMLGFASLVSLTDHDSIEAPALLRAVPETAGTPLALEWSVPFRDTVFHLGVHNLPEARAQDIAADLASYRRNPSDRLLIELLAMLDEMPEVLVVFNHPLWDQSDIGNRRDDQVLDRFLRCSVKFLHALEFNATRSSRENDGAMELAYRCKRPLISGGDRHGCEPSGALNLTRADSFAEFVHEIRRGQRSHVLLMPQYAEPLSIRVARTLLDVIREYPDYPTGSRRWDDRVFHPDDGVESDRPLSTLWKAPPAFIEHIFSVVRVLENATVQRALRRFFRGAVGANLPSEISSEAAS
jgi:hypothetical protein